MFRLVTLNLNGIRSAATKGFVAWADKRGADCMGVQEIKAQADDIAGRFERIAGLKRPLPLRREEGLRRRRRVHQAAAERRVVGFGDASSTPKAATSKRASTRPKRKLSVDQLLLPERLLAASSGRQAKFRFLDAVSPHLMRSKAEREFILVGDINIAHKEIDLKNWRGNQKNSGFLPEERAWMTRLLEEAGLVDVFRTLEPDSPSNTPGGATAARPAPRTSAGGSTTTSPRRASRRRRGASRSTSSSASPTTRR